MTQEQTPRIFVVCLATYVNGKLHGTLIECDRTDDGIWVKFNAMLAKASKPRVEDWAIPDFENLLGIQNGDYNPVEQIAELTRTVKERGKAFAVYCHHYGEAATPEKFQAHYLGKFRNDEDFVYQQFSKSGKLAELEELGIVEDYLDFEAIADDWFVNSHIAIDVGYEETYVFSRQ